MLVIHEFISATNLDNNNNNNLPATHPFQPLVFETNGTTHSSATDFECCGWSVNCRHGRPARDRFFFGSAFLFYYSDLWQVSGS